MRISRVSLFIICCYCKIEKEALTYFSYRNNFLTSKQNLDMKCIQFKTCKEKTIIVLKCSLFCLLFCFDEWRAKRCIALYASNFVGLHWSVFVNKENYWYLRQSFLSLQKQKVLCERREGESIQPTLRKKGYSFTLSLSTPFCFGESAKMEFLVEEKRRKKGVSSFISLFHQAKGKSGSSTLLKKRKCPHFSLIKKD